VPSWPDERDQAPAVPRAPTGSARPLAADALEAGIVMKPAAPAPKLEPQSEPVAPPAPQVAAPTAPRAPAAGPVVDDAEDWLERVSACELGGPARQLASNTAFVSHVDGVLTLALDPGFEYLRTERSVGALAEALAGQLGAAPKIVVQTGEAPAETLHQRMDRERGSRQAAAEQTFLNDPTVRRLVEQHGARVVPDSIRPVDEN